MINIELGHYLALGGVIFLLGVVGIFLNRKNVIVILMSVELILLSVNINLVAFSTYSNEIIGQVFTFFHTNCCSCRSRNRFSNYCFLLPK